VPPLRAREGDALLISHALIKRYADTYKKGAIDFSQSALAAISNYPWPGNVRELRNVIERLMIMVPGETIALGDLAFLDGGALSAADPSAPPPLPLHDARERFERDYILRALASQHGNISRTAEILGVERSNLYRKMRAFGILPRQEAV
jgi:DNA-binding NtrC family response regulator